MATHDDNLSALMEMFLHTEDGARVAKAGIAALLPLLRVEHAYLVPELCLGSFKELKVGLDRVHGDDEMVAIMVCLDVLQTYVGLALLWLSDDRVKTLVVA
tara:strand:- start:241 stop:543 length:303 start_codon:yes stop_codon:yes gene_type:complete